jgi:hypothetical protein
MQQASLSTQIGSEERIGKDPSLPSSSIVPNKLTAEIQLYKLLELILQLTRFDFLFNKTYNQGHTSNFIRKKQQRSLHKKIRNKVKKKSKSKIKIIKETVELIA